MRESWTCGVVAAACAALVGCTSAPPAGDGDTGATGGSTTTGGSTATTDACDVDPGPVTSGTAAPETTGCVGEGECEFPPALFGAGCPAEWAGADVVGEVANTCFHGTTALFGYKGCGEPWGMEIHLFHESTDYASATDDWGFQLVIENNDDFSLSGWYGELHGARVWTGDTYLGSLHPRIVVAGRAGNWQSYDPLDPPRLLGWIEGDPESGLHGPFDAALCDAFINLGFCPD